MPSASDYSQNARLIGLTTPLGEDVLLLRSMLARERLSGLFEFELDLLSESDEISAADLLGQSATVRLDMRGQTPRYFNGFISRLSHIGYEGRLARYQATLVPWLWLLTRTSDCRIFQEMTAPDIVKQVFRDAGMTDFDDRLSASYRAWEYCVQYRETHFNFVSRLMEHEGIYWYFTHDDGKHTLVMADGYGSHEVVPGYEDIAYHAADLAAERDQDFISAWALSSAVRSGAYVHDAFDFKKPSAELRTTSALARQHAHAEHEIYDYPGDYVITADGDRYAAVRMEELQADYEIARAEGYARGLSVGHLFTLTDHPRADRNREYLILSAEHQLRTDLYQTRDGAPEEPIYKARFSAADAQSAYRAPRITPKPVVKGPQTAIVVGPPGEEIWTDEYGRVKVQFHWDRYGGMDENSSCWIRVSHPWAGQNWGAVAIPRIGQEVIVSFLEGDADRPIITGRVYNADCMPPYGLPGSAVISGLKSNSTKGGGGYNEYVMDDTKGNELIREHAQFDKDSTIENDLREHVLNNRSRDVAVDETISIGNNQTETIGVDQTYSIGANQTGKVGANRSTSVGANDTESIGANQTETVGGMKTETIAVAKALSIGAGYQVSVGGGMNETIGAVKMEEIGGAKVVSVGAISSEDVGASKSVNAGTNISESAGAKFSASSGSTMSFSAGGDLSATSKAKVLIDAASEITLKCGGSQIVLKSGGDILIKGTNITIKASGKIGAKAGGPMTLKGSKIAEN